MATEATDYVLNGNGRHESGDTSPRVTETPTETPIVENGNVKSGPLLRFIRPKLWVEEGAGGSVPRVCEVEGRLCKWTHTKSNSQNMAPASLAWLAYRRSRTTKP